MPKSCSPRQSTDTRILILASRTRATTKRVQTVCSKTWRACGAETLGHLACSRQKHGGHPMFAPCLRNDRRPNWLGEFIESRLSFAKCILCKVETWLPASRKWVLVGSDAASASKNLHVMPRSTHARGHTSLYSSPSRHPRRPISACSPFAVRARLLTSWIALISTDARNSPRLCGVRGRGRQRISGARQESRGIGAFRRRPVDSAVDFSAVEADSDGNTFGHVAAACCQTQNKDLSSRSLLSASAPAPTACPPPHQPPTRR
jgi:hypothetical protein